MTTTEGAPKTKGSGGRPLIGPRFTFPLPDALYLRLYSEAQERGVPMAQLVRCVLDEGLPPPKG
jgi:hypothetical protein